MIHAMGARQAWTPRKLAGCVLWLRADESNLVLSGSKVVTWLDRSGLGNNVTQSTDANRPSRVANARLAYNGVLFGANLWLENVNSLFAATSARTVIFVARCNSTTGGPFLTNRRSAVYQSTSVFNPAPRYIYGDGVNVAANITVADWTVTNTFYFIETLNGNIVDNPRVRVNGAEKAITSSSTHQTTETGSAGFFVGKNSAGQYNDSYLFDLFAYSRKITDTELFAGERYIQSRYAL